MSTTLRRTHHDRKDIDRQQHRAALFWPNAGARRVHAKDIETAPEASIISHVLGDFYPDQQSARRCFAFQLMAQFGVIGHHGAHRVPKVRAVVHHPQVAQFMRHHVVNH